MDHLVNFLRYFPMFSCLISAHNHGIKSAEGHKSDSEVMNLDVCQWTRIRQEIYVKCTQFSTVFNTFYYWKLWRKQSVTMKLCSGRLDMQTGHSVLILLADGYNLDIARQARIFCIISFFPRYFQLDWKGCLCYLV